ncbi:sulfurtransferase TusA family protein [Allorhizobium sp. BGMRC 0089]|uniref:sulfurtransferase TusA family protein n=1 Tax=Allorhizobium sonneratiae TaxID=2934936 RepID=UPI0020344085|nr:sulfurtransferase TusA family protein [Allorhizobium sonneratiae]MCM2293504.1 sulfurtransferase TusA family protein [Allorhizobium sonneratiae]
MSGDKKDDPVFSLDLKGLKCPLPVLKTRKKLASMTRCARLRVETTDPLAGIDIPHLCHEDGHRLLASEKTSSGHCFLIEKA